MWRRFREVLVRLRQWYQRSAAERRVVKARARFWAGVREGEREAETHSPSLTSDAMTNGESQP
jgi:hypothetical protein